MISLRYHAVSIAAVFLALAVGVVLGASGVSDRVLAAVSTQRDDLSGQVAHLTAERDGLPGQQPTHGGGPHPRGELVGRAFLRGQHVPLGAQPGHLRAQVVALGGDGREHPVGDPT
jgi:hypothetical protein